MNLEQYDKWIISNQKKILDWTRKFDKQRYAPIRDAFSNYHNAKSNKQRIASFEKLKDELKLSSGKSFNDLVETTYKSTKQKLQKIADDYTKGDIEALDRNSNYAEDLKTYDELSPLYEATSTIPEKVKDYNWVELDKAFRDNYGYEEMKALADKYNFDYTDPKERKEFIELVSDIEQKRLKEEAYAPNDVAGMVTQIAYPVTLEHARKTDEIDPKAMGFDLASQAVMAGGEGVGNMIGNKIGGSVAANVGSKAGGWFTAPAITEFGQYKINNKPAEDALADYAVGVGTNIFAPGGVKSMLRTFDAPFTAGEKGAVRQLANKFADEYEQIIRNQRTGIPYRHIPNLKNEFYAKLSKKLSSAEKEGTQIDINKLIKETDQEVMSDYKSKLNIENEKSGTGVYKQVMTKKGLKEKELTPKELRNENRSIINITPEDREKEFMFKWGPNKNNQYQSDALTYLTNKKLTGQEITPNDLAIANIKETPVHAAARVIGRYTEPLKSLSMNLGASTRFADRKFGMADRYLNLPWKYGEKEEREIDFNKPEIKAYMKAYGRYKGNENYFKEPPKPKGYSEEEIDKIKKAVEIISINDIFGGE